MTRTERVKAQRIAASIYFSHTQGRTRKEKVSLIEKKAKVSRRYANKLYSDLDRADMVSYVVNQH